MYDVYEVFYEELCVVSSVDANYDVYDEIFDAKDGICDGCYGISDVCDVIIDVYDVLLDEERKLPDELCANDEDSVDVGLHVQWNYGQYNHPYEDSLILDGLVGDSDVGYGFHDLWKACDKYQASCDDDEVNDHLALKMEVEDGDEESGDSEILSFALEGDVELYDDK